MIASEGWYWCINIILDPSDDELRVAFTQYGREKNGSGLSAVEQLARLNAEFPLLNIKYVCSLIVPGQDTWAIAMLIILLEYVNYLT
jgi:hypothetical protein